MRFAVFLLAIICGALSDVPAEENQVVLELDDPVDNALNQFFIGNHIFTSDVYEQMVKIENGSFVYSPFSAETILALAYEGAKGETAAELVAGLSLPYDERDIHYAVQAIMTELKKFDEGLKIFTANKIFVGAGVGLEDDFKKTASEIYHSGVENVDFSHNFEAAKTINDWVENNTNNKIHDIVDANSIDGGTKMYLVNTIYFNGKWQNAFDVTKTVKKNFYKSEKDQVEVDTMKQVGLFNYFENAEMDAKFLEMPYLDTDFNFVIVLPNKKEGLASLEKYTDAIFERQEFAQTRVDIEIPKFTIETKIDFIPILKNLDIVKAFGGGADFSGISSTDKDMFISEVMQKAFVNVTEAGTEAAAATSVEISGISAGRQLPVEATFHADHPFFYYIRGGDLIFFAGRYYS